jgi:hypothetical protein
VGSVDYKTDACSNLARASFTPSSLDARKARHNNAERGEWRKRMSIVRSVCASLVAITVATAPLALSASDAAVPKDGKAVQTKTVDKAPPVRFVSLKDIKASPMPSSELAAVKGQHAHFWNPGAPFPGPPHVVNEHNLSNWSDLFGQGPVGPGYNGLCKAQAKSPAIFINPGGGCGF